MEATPVQEMHEVRIDDSTTHRGVGKMARTLKKTGPNFGFLHAHAFN